MTHFKLRSLLTRALVLTFAFATIISAQTDKNAPVQMDDAQVVDQLSSRDWKQATAAVSEVVRRGEQMVPLLVKLKGRNEIFTGFGLGNPNGASVRSLRIKGKVPKKELIVTVEIAALYLISAVHFENAAFAQSPFLTDLTLPANDRSYNNGDALVGKAWKSTIDWYSKYQEIGISDLRLNKDHPLKGSDVAFW